MGKCSSIHFKPYGFFLKFSFYFSQSFTCTLFKKSSNPTRPAVKNILLPTSQSPFLQFSIFQRHLLSNLIFLISFFLDNMLILLYLEFELLVSSVAFPFWKLFYYFLSTFLPHMLTSSSPFSQFGPLIFLRFPPIFYLFVFFLCILGDFLNFIFHSFLHCIFSGVLVLLNACVHTCFFNQRSDYC